LSSYTRGRFLTRPLVVCGSHTHCRLWGGVRASPRITRSRVNLATLDRGARVPGRRESPVGTGDILSVHSQPMARLTTRRTAQWRRRMLCRDTPRVRSATGERKWPAAARACRRLDCPALADRPCGKGPRLHRPGAASAVRSTCLQARVGQPRERRGPSSCHHDQRRSPFPG
jgi:hypothetical protein